MPLHRIKKGEDPAGDLAGAVLDRERAGEAVVRWDERDDEWLILTRPPKRSADVEMRSSGTSALMFDGRGR